MVQEATKADEASRSHERQASQKVEVQDPPAGGGDAAEGRQRSGWKEHERVWEQTETETETETKNETKRFKSRPLKTKAQKTLPH